MTRSIKFVCAALAGLAALALYAAREPAPVTPIIGRFQIVQGRWTTKFSGGLPGDMTDAPIRLDTVTGKTWAYRESFNGSTGEMYRGWLEMDAYHLLNADTNVSPNPHPTNSTFPK